MSRKTDAATYTFIAIIAMIYMLYSFVIEYYIQIIVVILFCLILYFSNKKYGFFGFIIPESLIADHIMHYQYEDGANIYVAKYICDEKINWSISKNP